MEELNPHRKANRRQWAYLIRQVFEVNPLICAHCDGEMKIISFIQRQQIEVIDRILDSLQIERHVPEPRGPPKWLQVLEAKKYLEQNQDLYPDDFNQDQEDPDTTLLDPA